MKVKNKQMHTYIFMYIPRFVTKALKEDYKSKYPTLKNRFQFYRNLYNIIPVYMRITRELPQLIEMSIFITIHTVYAPFPRSIGETL